MKGLKPSLRTSMWWRLAGSSSDAGAGPRESPLTNTSASAGSPWMRTVHQQRRQARVELRLLAGLGEHFARPRRVAGARHRDGVRDARARGRA